MASSSNAVERIANPANLKTYPPNPTTTRGAASHLTFHPKNPSVIIYCSGKVVVVRNIEDPSSDVLVYKGHNDRTTVAKFSPNGYWVASADVTGKVRVWSYDNPEHTLKIEVPVFAGEVKDLVWGPESKRIVAVGDGRGMMARAFMYDTGNSIGEIVGHQKRVLSVDYKPTRPFRVVTSSEDFNVCVYTGPPFKFSQNVSGNHTNFVNCIRYNPAGDAAVSVGSDKQMLVYDASTGDLVDKFPVEHTVSIYSVVWSPDGSALLTASGDKTVKQWDVASKSCTVTYSFSKNPALAHMQVSVAWSTSHKISLSLSGDINFLDESNPATPARIIHGHQVSLMALASTANSIITGSYDGVVCEWNTNDDVASVLSGDGHTAKVTSIGADDTVVASTGWDDAVRIASGSPLTYNSNVSLNGQPNGVAVAKGLCVCSTSKGVKLVKDGMTVFETPETNSWTPTCVAISSDGTMVAAGADDMKIYLYDVVDSSTLKEVGEIVGHRGALCSVKFSPDGKTLAAGDANREVRVWEVGSRSAIVEGMWVFHTTRVTSVAWSPCGKFVASGSLDESIYIWNVESPMKKAKFEYCHKDGVTGVAFLNAETLVSIGNDGVVNQWKVTLPQ